MSSIEVLLDVDQLSILCHTANNSIGWIANHSVASTAASGAASTAASAKEQPCMFLPILFLFRLQPGELNGIFRILKDRRNCCCSCWYHRLGIQRILERKSS